MTHRHDIQTQEGLEDAIAEVDTIEDEINLLSLRLRKLKEILHLTRKAPGSYNRRAKPHADKDKDQTAENKDRL